MVRCRQRKAFTIVEMVIVIAVIAILAAAMIPAISGVINMANKSADQQFAASLNIQLALWSVDNGEIENESDLRNAINYYYGEWEDEEKTVLAEGGDFYATLAPKSGKYGYHYWYDVENKQVVLSTYNKLVDPDGDGITGIAGEEFSFSPASIRAGLVDGYFFMDHGTGSPVAAVIEMLETMASPNDYEELLIKTLPELEADEEHAGFAAKIKDRLEKTTILTPGCAFRHSDTSKIAYVWIPARPATLSQMKVFVYNGDVVDDGQNSNEIADSENVIVTGVELPSCVEIGIGGLPAIKVDTYDETQLIRDYANTTKLHVNVEDIKELEKVFTNCVLVMPNGVEYIYVGNELYALPLTIDAETQRPTAAPVGTVDSSAFEIDEIIIECISAVSQPNSGKIFKDPNTDGKLYVAYDQKEFNLSLADGVTNDMANWTSNNGLISVVNGKVTLSLPEVTQGAIYEAKITATYKYDETKADDITVYIVRPVSVDFKIGDTIVTLNNDTDKGALNFEYTGDNDILDISKITAVDLNQSGMVKTEVVAGTGTPSLDCGSDGLISVVDAGGKLKIDLNKIGASGTASQDVTVSYTGESGTKYFERVYTITVVDNSDCALEKKEIAAGVTMGETYLFRVGNGNPIKLSSLFAPADSNKPVKIEKIELFDALTATNNSDGVYTAGQLPTTGGTLNGQGAIDANNWGDSTVKFGGTGIAIIQVQTGKGYVKLVVEVVNGKNVTSYGELDTNTNNVLLNNIEMPSGTLYLNGDAINHKVLYGNGFTLDIIKGSSSGNGIINLNNADLDNIRIIGALYENYVASGSSNAGYSSAVHITGGSAKISNSYIYGTKANIFMKSDLEVVNTVLDGARLAGISVENGTLTVDGLTTIGQPNSANKNVMGVGIVFPDGASSSAKVIVKGAFNAYNWVASSDTKHLPNVTGMSEAVSTLFNQTAFVHTINETEYVNLAIVSMEDSVPETNVTITSPYQAQTMSVSGFSGFMVAPLDANYNATASDLTYRSNVYSWTPTAQCNTVPTISWSAHGNGTADVTFEKGQSGTFNPNVFTATKHGKTITHAITVNGVDYTGKNITFTEAQTCVIKYTVVDRLVYNQAGTAIEPVTYEYELVVNVTTTNPQQTEPKFSFTNATGTQIVEVNDKKYVVPTFTDSSKFYDVGNGIYAPIVDVQIKNGVSDFTGYYPIFGGVSITWYNASNEEKTYNASSDLSALPTGEAKLEWLSDVASLKGGKTDWVGYAKYSSYGLCRQSAADGSSNSSDTYKNVEFSFQAEGSEKYYYYIRFKEPKHTKPCVTPDTLVTLADGTQKRIDELTGNEELLVWDFYKGEYTSAGITIIVNHGAMNNEVIELIFEDGTTVKAVNRHGFFNVDLGEWVDIGAQNAEELIGSKFIVADGDTCKTVKLVEANISVEYVEAWSLATEKHYNCFVNGVLSTTPFEPLNGQLTFFETTSEMIYDTEKMQQDINLYGLYSYDEFAHLLTEKDFEALNIAEFKVLVGKGHCSIEDVYAIINAYLYYAAK